MSDEQSYNWIWLGLVSKNECEKDRAFGIRSFGLNLDLLLCMTLVKVLGSADEL